ncbi:MAG: hypothetical protein HF314_07345 [Ignavibacteria bacterium]|jgi:hypothetical protein|nr:hypothetical protein [Ignavibacteria bacterium]MCU7502870.1 hypothetical protein [Ignavibacteria bacterium]MCU7515636.1 hypothetical protein [Ignavibacteria bacterium]
MSSSTPTETKKSFKEFMTYEFVPKYSNNIMGIVYIGAAILIIIVGLRGLGSVVSQISFIPKAILDPSTGKIHPNLVIFALILEFCVLLMMAFTTYFTPVENHKSSEANTMVKSTALSNIKEELDQLKELTEQDVKLIDNYLSDFEQISAKLANIQMNYVQALSTMKQAIKN